MKLKFLVLIVLLVPFNLWAQEAFVSNGNLIFKIGDENATELWLVNKSAKIVMVIKRMALVIDESLDQMDGVIDTMMNQVAARGYRGSCLPYLFVYESSERYDEQQSGK